MIHADKLNGKPIKTTAFRDVDEIKYPSLSSASEWRGDELDDFFIDVSHAKTGTDTCDTGHRETQNPEPRTQNPNNPPSPAVGSVSTVSPNLKENSGNEFLHAVFEAAKAKPIPPDASKYYLPGIRLLVALCQELQIAAEGKTFFLSCRDAGALLCEDYRRVSKWLSRLERDGLLVRVSTGNIKNHKANEYRYNGGQS